LPNVHHLVNRFRLLGLPIVFTRLGTLLQDGADLPAWSWRRVQQVSAPDGTQPLHHVGSPEHALIEEFQPMPNELVLDRPTYNPFNSSALEQALRNMGVQNLVVAGLLTEVAVETTARSAGERGFWVILAEDACATLSAEEHAAAMSGLAWCVPRSTDEVLALLTPQAILL
jgi:nicotinamidase-related amidase